MIHTCYTSGRRCPDRRIFYTCMLMSAIATLCLAAAPAQPSPATSPPADTPNPSLPLPGAFAPAPFALPGSRQAAQKQLCSLIRRLEPVQNADLLVTGDGSTFSCKLLLTCRPGRRMTPATLESIIQLCSGSLTDLTLKQLSILDTQGNVLYRDGSVQSDAFPPPVGPHPLPWLLAASALAVIGTFLALQGRRVSRTRSDGFWDSLTRHQEADLLSLLLGERPEMAGLLLANLPPALAGRLYRKLRRHQISVVAPMVPADAQVVETVKASLQQQLRRG